MNHDFKAMRDAMVESQLRTNAVSDARVIKAMSIVPREKFMPEEKQSLAYAEIMVPLSPERRQNLALATGRLLSETAPGPSDTVLVVGSATGYTAAVCGELAGTVTALEEDAGLSATAERLLADSLNVKAVTGALTEGYEKYAPYDVVIIDWAVEHIPEAIVAQLADGGRLAGGIIEDGISRLAFGRKQGEAFGVATFFDVECATLPGFAKPREFAFWPERRISV